MKIGLIGATGWLGSALGKGLLREGLVAPKDLILLNRSGPRPDYHGQTGVTWARDAAELSAQSDVIILSLRPEDWPALQFSAEGKLLLSFMAGITGADLAAKGGRVIRVMPNAAAEVGTSYSPFWAGAGASREDRALTARLLSVIGTSDEVETEPQIDLMSAVSGSGAAYPALMALAMVGFLKENGVSEAIAWRAAEAAVVGGSGMLAGRIHEAPALLEAYHAYRGVTAAGLSEADAKGFSAAMKAALEAASAKARQMADPSTI